MAPWAAPCACCGVLSCLTCASDLLALGLGRQVHGLLARQVGRARVPRQRRVLHQGQVPGGVVLATPRSPGRPPGPPWACSGPSGRRSGARPAPGRCPPARARAPGRPASWRPPCAARRLRVVGEAGAPGPRSAPWPAGSSRAPAPCAAASLLRVGADAFFSLRSMRFSIALLPLSPPPPRSENASKRPPDTSPPMPKNTRPPPIRIASVEVHDLHHAAALALEIEQHGRPESSGSRASRPRRPRARRPGDSAGSRAPPARCSSRRAGSAGSSPASA